MSDAVSISGAGWGSTRFKYTLEQLKKTTELLTLNRGKISSVIEICIAERIISEKPDDICHWIRMVEKIGQLVDGADEPFDDATNKILMEVFNEAIKRR